MVKNPVEETMTFQALAQVTAAAVVVAAALLFAAPFLLALLRAVRGQIRSPVLLIRRVDSS